jgi:hypothetical protein
VGMGNINAVGAWLRAAGQLSSALWLSEAVY